MQSVKNSKIRKVLDQLNNRSFELFFDQDSLFTRYISGEELTEQELQTLEEETEYIVLLMNRITEK